MNKSKPLQYDTTLPEQMELSTNIDWISVTYPFRYLDKDYPMVMPDDHKSGFQMVRGNNGYTQAKQYPSGALEMINHQHESMGVHVVYSAQAIAYACENFGCEQWEILDYLSQSAKISRLDIALDVHNVEIDIRQLHADALSGKIKTRVKTLDYVERAEIGQEKGARTLYFGSMTKRKKLLRVYDKGMQLNLDNYLTRFELETHGLIASNATKTLLSDIENMAQTIRAMISGYVNMRDSLPDEIFTNDDIKIALPKYKKSNTAEWLIGTVAKTLANEVYSDRSVFDEFISMFQYHLNEKINSEGFNE